ncbi:molybdate ABC transporter substrate-binding protein [Compostimonas suwonensis]|uniref:Molybdate transport system substrate-binding protein n=1 Tax=Compostimonas suwonensis TaxID=1048394 RepID=A0A2M9BU06_9MICO|nr:molybdate ABC transporter substrate-binding protein [Compostimonas suwonensis]PJJ61436.1 molybdate transport system substrate-binding protein [Compostimonas suwonensis]
MTSRTRLPRSASSTTALLTTALRGAPVLAALALVAALAGCAPAADAPSAAASSEASSTPGREAQHVEGAVTVFAAASLTGTFTELAKQFEQANPDATVTLNFGGSSALAEQINQGAPADVFAAASPATMTTVVDAGGVAGEPTVFASNTLEIAVPPGNPGGITGIADFGDEAKTIALCAPEVPCGAAAATVFEKAGITAAPDTLEQDVKAALTKVQLGEVDAAMVYRTDVLAAGDGVEGIEFAEAADAVNDYPIAVLSAAPNPTGAQAFVDFVLSEGAGVLAAAGFDAG